MTRTAILGGKRETADWNPSHDSSGESGSDPVGDLLRELRVEQQSLSAVEQFAQDHAAEPSQARYYARLLPAAPPGPGQQYAFEVDLDRCSGCKSCVVACHELNGLDESETWRDVGLLVGGSSHSPVWQHVTTACHHCIEPACLAACPVNAYDKDPLTGIVRHWDDQCFGCQYCVLACPYDVPKYNAARGIVRKCDLCAGRLAQHEAPACVQACPHEAIAIRVVDMTQVVENAEVGSFLPAAPESHLTLPTTVFKTERVLPRNTLPADYYALSPQPPHWPLIVMLVLTQLSVGAFCVGTWLAWQSPLSVDPAFLLLHATAATAWGLLALGASLLHLGRPQFAYRAVLGLGHSWLSREILAFGLFAGAAVLYTAAVWSGLLQPVALRTFEAVVAGAGVAAVFCSIMIYVFTRREFWNFERTGSRFLLTGLLLGISAVWLTIALLKLVQQGTRLEGGRDWGGAELAPALMATVGIKLVLELAQLRHHADPRNSPMNRSARLLTGLLSNAFLARMGCGLFGGLVLPMFIIQSLSTTGSQALPVEVLMALSFVACLAGEILERYLFFAAVAAPRMPGSIR